MLASTLSENDEFNKWLSEAESKLNDDVISFKVFDLQVITEKRNALEVSICSYVFLVKMGTLERRGSNVNRQMTSAPF